MMRWGEWLVRTSTYASTLLIELSEGDSTGGDDDVTVGSSSSERET